MIKEYNEYFIEYDNDNLVVYLSGLDDDNFWTEIEVFDEVNDPESFALGIHEGFKAKGIFSTVDKVVYDD